MWRAARGRAGAGLWSSTYPLRFHKWTEKGRRRTLCPMFLLGGGGGRRGEERRGKRTGDLGMKKLMNTLTKLRLKKLKRVSHKIL